MQGVLNSNQNLKSREKVMNTNIIIKIPRFSSHSKIFELGFFFFSSLFSLRTIFFKIDFICICTFIIYLISPKKKKKKISIHIKIYHVLTYIELKI